MTTKRVSNAIEPKYFETGDEIDASIKMLKKRIAEVEALKSGVSFDDPVKNTTESKIVNTILNIFGPKSQEYHDNQYHSIRYGTMTTLDTVTQHQDQFIRGIEHTLSMLTGLIEMLEERKEFLPNHTEHDAISEINISYKDVFIVHGHDVEVIQSVARFVQCLHLNPIIISEQPKQGMTIIEAIEKYSNVAFAIVLLTPDDVGALREEINQLKPRARQNVILELGFCIGKLGRNHVCAVLKDDIEKPSDYDGVLYISYDDNQAWKLMIAQEMRSAGLQIDFNDLE